MQFIVLMMVGVISADTFLGDRQSTSELKKLKKWMEKTTGVEEVIEDPRFWLPGRPVAEIVCRVINVLEVEGGGRLVYVEDGDSSCLELPLLDADIRVYEGNYALVALCEVVTRKVRLSGGGYSMAKPLYTFALLHRLPAGPATLGILPQNPRPIDYN